MKTPGKTRWGGSIGSSGSPSIDALGLAGAGGLDGALDSPTGGGGGLGDRSGFTSRALSCARMHAMVGSVAVIGWGESRIHFSLLVELPFSLEVPVPILPLISTSVWRETLLALPDTVP